MYDHIYSIVFEDGTVFTGGSTEYPGWNKFPKDKKIKKLELNLPNMKDKITLEGYEQYNFFIGAKKILNKDATIICHMYGLGHRKGIVTSYRITLVSDGLQKHKVGDVTVRKFPLGKEGIGRTSTLGWKEGTGE
jgi:hypothetical protein